MARKQFELTGVEIRIEKLIPGGQGLGQLADGKKVMLWNALPGEVVARAWITKNKSSYAEGVALEILPESRSVRRVEPVDPCYLSTSPWQMMDFAYEVEMKGALVREAFAQEGLAAEMAAAREADADAAAAKVRQAPLFYRNKMEYALYWNNEQGRIELAFHRRGSHTKEPVAQSSLERPEIWQRAQEVVADLNNRGEEARNYQSLLLRCNQKGEVSGGLYRNGEAHPVFPELRDSLLGHEYAYSPNGFFQINLPVYEAALRRIREFVAPGAVLDLYSGVGTIGLSVAADRRLTLVECNKFAYGELVKNALARLGAEFTGVKIGSELAGVRPVEGVARFGERGEVVACLAKSEEALEYVAPDQTVIVDPPRAGCHKELLERLLEVTPATIIYLSCNPATQARDVRILAEKYRIDYAEWFNFFPRTPHIENLVVLKLK